MAREVMRESLKSAKMGLGKQNSSAKVDKSGVTGDHPGGGFVTSRRFGAETLHCLSLCYPDTPGSKFVITLILQIL